MNAQDVANTLYDAHYVMDGEPTETTYRALKALGVEHDEALRMALQAKHQRGAACRYSFNSDNEKY